MATKFETQPKSVALYGFASESRDGVKTSSADEIWSIGWAYKYDVPRIDLLLEIHPIWLQALSKKPEYQKPRDHWAWMKQNTTIPILMLIDHSEVPMGSEYPLRDAAKLVPRQRRTKVFTSSFDFLMALAILRGVMRIEVYGFEMGSDTEYRYQREGAAYWIGQCDARGIELILPSNTALLKNKLYGYESGSMIYRQDLERIKRVREEQKRDAFARLSYYEGAMRTAMEVGDEEKAKQISLDWDEQYRKALVSSGALQDIEYLLKHIDLEEPSSDLEVPVQYIKLKEEQKTE